MKLDRRELLVGSAALAAGSRLAPRLLAAPTRDEIDELVRWIVTTPREPALRRGARELASDLAPARLLGALQIAAAREIRTDRARFNHAALVVSSIDQLSLEAALDERRHLALWCLDQFKESQEFEASSDDWRMKPVDASKLPRGTEARAALVDALERWDAAAADVALAGWVRSAPLDEVYALAWEYGLRCPSNLGHKAIYAALSRRALPLAGEQHAEDVLRSVVNSFFLDGRTDAAAAFERSREEVARGFERIGETGEPRRSSPRMGGGGRGDPAASPASGSEPEFARELLHALRTLAPEQVPHATAELVRRGAERAALWDAIVVAACEVSIEDPSIGPLHALTSVNSLHHIALEAPNERVASLALLQAAAWTRRFHARGPTKLRLDELEPSEALIDDLLGDVLGAPTSSSTDVARRALSAASREPAQLVRLGLQTVRANADDVHELKLAAAAIEEARRAGPWARPAALAALAVHLPRRTDSPRLAEIRSALELATR